MTSDSSTGLDGRIAAILCYSVWWITGALFLVIERRDTAVRFHAAQSLVLFGVLSALLLGTGVLSALALVLSSGLFRVLQLAGNVLWVVAALLWLVLVLLAWRGETWRVPLVAALADGLAART